VIGDASSVALPGDRKRTRAAAAASGCSRSRRHGFAVRRGRRARSRKCRAANRSGGSAPRRSARPAGRASPRTPPGPPGHRARLLLHCLGTTPSSAAASGSARVRASPRPRRRAIPDLSPAPSSRPHVLRRTCYPSSDACAAHRARLDRRLGHSADGRRRRCPQQSRARPYSRRSAGAAARESTPVGVMASPPRVADVERVGERARLAARSGRPDRSGRVTSISETPVSARCSGRLIVAVARVPRAGRAPRTPARGVRVDADRCLTTWSSAWANSSAVRTSPDRHSRLEIAASEAGGPCGGLDRRILQARIFLKISMSSCVEQPVAVRVSHNTLPTRTDRTARCWLTERDLGREVRRLPLTVPARQLAARSRARAGRSRELHGAFIPSSTFVRETSEITGAGVPSARTRSCAAPSPGVRCDRRRDRPRHARTLSGRP